MDENRFDSLPPEQRAAVKKAARELHAAGVDYVLAVGNAGDGHVLSNMCPHCASALLSGALAGAMERADREGGHVAHETLQ